MGLVCLGMQVRNEPTTDAVACPLPHVALHVLGAPSCACFLVDFCLVPGGGAGGGAELVGIDPKQHLGNMFRSSA